MKERNDQTGICNHDCINCQFPDCIVDGYTAEELTEMNQRDHIVVMDNKRKGIPQTQEKASKLEYNRMRYSRLKPLILAQRRLKREQDPDGVKLYWKKWCKEHHSEYLEGRRRWYSKNKEQISLKRKLKRQQKIYESECKRRLQAALNYSIYLEVTNEEAKNHQTR